MNTLIFRCPPGGQFHFGRIATDDKTSLDDTSVIFHSDTFASALVEVAFRVFGEGSPFAKTVLNHLQSGAIRVSSFFYCLENKAKSHRVFFLPKPVNLDAKDHGDNNKKIRKIEFISKGVLDEKILPSNWFDNPLVIILQGKFVLLKTELEDLGITTDFKIYSLDTVPKVMIHKPKKEDNLYFHGNIFLSPDPRVSVHFYCLLDHQLDENDWLLFKSLFEIMADEGIGGERSVGCGRLLGVEDLGDFDLKNEIEPSFFLTLSLTSPKGEDDLKKAKAWRTVTRGGRHTTSDGDLKRIKMMAEGALSQSRLEGDYSNLAIINPENRPYYRFGFPVSIPLPKEFAEYDNS